MTHLQNIVRLASGMATPLYWGGYLTYLFITLYSISSIITSIAHLVNHIDLYTIFVTFFIFILTSYLSILMYLSIDVRRIMNDIPIKEISFILINMFINSWIFTVIYIIYVSISSLIYMFSYILEPVINPLIDLVSRIYYKYKPTWFMKLKESHPLIYDCLTSRYKPYRVIGLSLLFVAIIAGSCGRRIDFIGNKQTISLCLLTGGHLSGFVSIPLSISYPLKDFLPDNYYKNVRLFILANKSFVNLNRNFLNYFKCFEIRYTPWLLSLIKSSSIGFFTSNISRYRTFYCIVYSTFIFVFGALEAILHQFIHHYKVVKHGVFFLNGDTEPAYILFDHIHHYHVNKGFHLEDDKLYHLNFISFIFLKLISSATVCLYYLFKFIEKNINKLNQTTSIYCLPAPTPAHTSSVKLPNGRRSFHSSVSMLRETKNSLNQETVPISDVCNVMGLDPSNVLPLDHFRHPDIEWNRSEWNFTQLPFPTNPECMTALTSVISSIKDGESLVFIPTLMSTPSGASTGVLSMTKSMLITNKTDPKHLHSILEIAFTKIIEQYELQHIRSFGLKHRVLSISSAPVVSHPKRTKLTDEETSKLRGAFEVIKQNPNTPFTSVFNAEDKKLLKGLFSTYYLPTKASDMQNQPLVKGSLDMLSYKNHTYKYSVPTVRDNFIVFYGVHFTNGKPNFSFVDTHFIDGGMKRTIFNTTVFFNGNGDQINFKTKFSGKKITIKRNATELNTKILSYDLEAYLNNGTFVPYAAGWHDGSNFNSFYLSQYKDPNQMIIASFDAILSSKKYDGYTVYVHNLSNFDSLFMLKALASEFKIDPFFHNNSLYSLNVSKQVKNEGTIKIKVVDSFKMLSFPLRTLAKSFEVNTLKGVFPYRFVSADNLEYVGVTPSYDFFETKDISHDDYNSLVKNDWSMKDETLKYLESDVLALFEVISKFSKEMFELEKVNVTDSLTIASLALNVFKTNYLNTNTFLSKIRSDLHNEIRNAYYGGRVDVFKPHGEGLYYYDVNSLYPTVMLKPMPVGKGVLTSEKNLNKLFGVVQARVVCPDNLSIPILPYRTKKGSLINPTGSWTSWYFSEELKMAVKHGYSVEVVKAIEFEKSEGLFDEYVNKYYKIKSNTSGPQKAIAKLMLNSLYGRMGLRPSFEQTELVSTERAESILRNYDVSDGYTLNAEKQLEIIRYSTVPSEEKAKINNVNFDELSLKADNSTRVAEQSLPVAIAITAYARMLMNPYFMKYTDSIYYTDTDSITMSEPLPDDIVGNDLGQFKLEHSNFEGYFPGCKVYALQLSNGDLIRKAKTVGANIELQNVIDLWKGKVVSVNKEYWARDRKAGSVSIVNKNIKLSPNLLKRAKVFDSAGIWVDTKPLVINEAPQELVESTLLTNDVVVPESIENNSVFPSNETSIGHAPSISTSLLSESEDYELLKVKYNSLEAKLVNQHAKFAKQQAEFDAKLVKVQSDHLAEKVSLQNEVTLLRNKVTSLETNLVSVNNKLDKLLSLMGSRDSSISEDAGGFSRSEIVSNTEVDEFIDEFESTDDESD